MLLGLAQIKFAGYVKVVLNVFFVVGSVCLVEADLVRKRLLVDPIRAWINRVPTLA